MGQEKSKATSGRSTLTQVIVVVVVLAIVAFFAYGLRFRGDPGPKIGQPASSFSLTTFDGRQIALNDLKGKVVVVNFWASWCKPACWDEAPDLERTWRKYKDRGVMFIGIDYVDTESEGLAFLKNFDITYPNGPDLGSKISQVYRVKGVPETVVIDKSGKIAAIGRGGISTAKYEGPIDASLLSATLDRLLAE
ncbi:MAG: hypothetical protein A2Z04_05190 [Chloroflexi bacterium RBG_16_57_9]|nr:MAG: hypothetical protein A2Z04_05190 [Chloroflexi bacterium RBG_16_57_9]